MFRLEEGGREALACANIRDRYARHILQTLVHGVVVHFHTVLCRDGRGYRIHQERPRASGTAVDEDQSVGREDILRLLRSL